MLYSCWVWAHYSRYWVYGLLKSTERSWEFKRSRGAGRTQSKGCVSPGKEHGWRYMASKTGLLFSFPSIYHINHINVVPAVLEVKLHLSFWKRRAERQESGTTHLGRTACRRQATFFALSEWPFFAVNLWWYLDAHYKQLDKACCSMAQRSPFCLVLYIQWSKQVLILWKQHFLHLQPNDQQTFSKTCKSNHKFYGALFYFVFWSILLTKQHITSQLSNIPNSSFACSFWTTSPPPCSPVIHQRTCQGPMSPAPCWTWHAPSGASSAHPDELWGCSPVATLRPVKTTGPSSGPSWKAAGCWQHHRWRKAWHQRCPSWAATSLGRTTWRGMMSWSPTCGGRSTPLGSCRGKNRNQLQSQISQATNPLPKKLKKNSSAAHLWLHHLCGAPAMRLWNGAFICI